MHRSQESVHVELIFAGASNALAVTRTQCTKPYRRKEMLYRIEIGKQGSAVAVQTVHGTRSNVESVFKNSCFVRSILRREYKLSESFVNFRNFTKINHIPLVLTS